MVGQKYWYVMYYITYQYFIMYVSFLPFDCRNIVYGKPQPKARSSKFWRPVLRYLNKIGDITTFS